MWQQRFKTKKALRKAFAGFEPPASEIDVTQAVDEDVLVLWRGANVQQATEVGRNRTAGGAAGGAAADDKPTDTEARNQVAEFASGRIVEYTTKWNVAWGFAGGNSSPPGSGAIVCIHIRKKYLRKGSGTESGWVIYSWAPLEKVRWTRTSSVRRNELPGLYNVPIT